jgi:hypothetical protein
MSVHDIVNEYRKKAETFKEDANRHLELLREEQEAHKLTKLILNSAIEQRDDLQAKLEKLKSANALRDLLCGRRTTNTRSRGSTTSQNHPKGKQ